MASLSFQEKKDPTSLLPEVPLGLGAELAPAASTQNISAREPAFAELRVGTGEASTASLQNLLDVRVLLTAELGRVSLEIGEVLKLGAGSVLELDRSVFEPVALMVQGICIGYGEVVVVNDHFAIRIKEIADPKRMTK